MTKQDATGTEERSTGDQARSSAPDPYRHVWMLFLSALGLWGSQLFLAAILVGISAIPADMGMAVAGAMGFICLYVAPVAVVSLVLFVVYSVIVKAYSEHSRTPAWHWVPLLPALATGAEIVWVIAKFLSY